MTFSSCNILHLLLLSWNFSSDHGVVHYPYGFSIIFRTLSTGCLGPYGAGPFTQAESLGSLKQFEAHRMDCRHSPPFVCLSLSKLKSCLFQNIFFVCLFVNFKVEKLFISKQLYILVLHMMIINCFYFCFNCIFWPKK
jgi:hypothetical protein